jgi:hypothetical protein
MAFGPLSQAADVWPVFGGVFVALNDIEAGLTPSQKHPYGFGCVTSQTNTSALIGGLSILICNPTLPQPYTGGALGSCNELELSKIQISMILSKKGEENQNYPE